MVLHNSNDKCSHTVYISIDNNLTNVSHSIALSAADFRSLFTGFHKHFLKGCCANPMDMKSLKYLEKFLNSYFLNCDCSKRILLLIILIHYNLIGYK